MATKYSITNVNDREAGPDGKITLPDASVPFLGSAKPTDTPTGTGAANWSATEAGTYTNFGGVVVNPNSFASISRDALGNFTISQTPIDLSKYDQLSKTNFFLDNFFSSVIREVYVQGNHTTSNIYLRSFYKNGDNYTFTLSILEGSTSVTLVTKTDLKITDNYVQLTNSSGDVVHILFDWSNINDITEINAQGFLDSTALSKKANYSAFSPYINQLINPYGSSFFKDAFYSSVIKEVYIQGDYSESVIYLRSFYKSGDNYTLTLSIWDGSTSRTLATKIDLKTTDNYIQMSNIDNNVVVHILFDWSNIGSIIQVNAQPYSESRVLSDKAKRIQFSPYVNNIINSTGFSVNDFKFYLGTYTLNGATWNGNIIANAVHKCAISNCSYGDTFLISTIGGSAAKAFAFVDANNNILLSSEDSLNTIPNPITVTAPYGSAKILVNALNFDTNFQNGKIYAGKINSSLNLRYKNEYMIDVRFEDNSLNSVFKELYISGVNVDANKTYVIRNFYYNAPGGTWVIAISEKGTGSLGVIISGNISNASSYVTLYNRNATLRAVVDWSEAVKQGVDIRTQDKHILKKRCFDLDFNSSIKSVIVSKKDLFNKQLIVNDSQNMMWTWWYHPQVVSYSNIRDCIYFGGLNNKGNRVICQHDNSTGITKKNEFSGMVAYQNRALNDDHNAISVNILSDGKIGCIFSGGHNADNILYIKISKKAEDIEEWEDVQQIQCTGVTSYSQVLKGSDGTYWLFFRNNSSYWYFTRSSDFKNWSTPTELIRDSVILGTSKTEMYIKVVNTNDPDYFRIAAYGHPDSIDDNIYTGLINNVTGDFYNNSGNVVGNVSSYTDQQLLTKVVNQIGNGYNRVRLLDVAVSSKEEAHISFCRYNNENNSKYYVYRNGSVFEVSTTYKSITGSYFGGQVFVGDENNVVLSRYEANVDYIDKYTFNGTSFVLDKSVFSRNTGASNQIRSSRPIADINGSNICVFSGYYDQNNNAAGLNVWALFNADALIFKDL